MNKDKNTNYIYKGLTATAVLLVCILFWYIIQHGSAVVGLIRKIFGIISPIVYGAVLAYLTAPIYNWVVQNGKKPAKELLGSERAARAACRLVGTCTCLALVALVIAGMFRLLIPQMLESLKGIRDSFPVYLQNLYAWIQQVLADNPEVERVVLANVQEAARMFSEWAESLSLSNIDVKSLVDIVSGVSSSVMNIFNVIMNWFIGIIVMVYLLNIKDVLAAQGKKIIYSCLGLKWGNGVVQELRFVHQVFGGFIIGKIVDSLIIGVICFIGVSFLKMPYPMLLSVIIGVTNVIPFFGPFIGAVPTGILVFLVSPLQCVYFLLWILVLQQFDGNILGPRILGNSTGLSSFWVLFSILLFGGLFGFVGMIIGVPAFAVIYDLLARAVHHSLRARKLPVETEEYKDLDHIDEASGKLVK